MYTKEQTVVQTRLGFLKVDIEAMRNELKRLIEKIEQIEEEYEREVNKS